MTTIKLSLKGIGPLKEGIIEFRDGPTLLYGPNNSGKTTIIRALNLALRLLSGFTVSTLDIRELINNESRESSVEITINEHAYVININEKRISITEGSQELTSYQVAGPNIKLISILLQHYPILWVKPWSLRIDAPLEQGNPLEPWDLLMASSLGIILNYYDISDHESRFANIYSSYIKEVNDTLSQITDHRVELIKNNIFFKDISHYYSYNYTADGVKWIFMISASLALANLLKNLEENPMNPIVVVETMETGLHYDYIAALINMLNEYKFPTILETHSGLALKLAYRGKLQYYIIEDGHIHSDLSSSTLFKSEMATYIE
ncbi:MAG: AAA family ATPase [Thermocladium sp.]